MKTTLLSNNINRTILCVLTAFLAFCTGCPKQLKTIDLTPTILVSVEDTLGGSTGWCFSMGNIPPTAITTGPNIAVVGFDDYFAPGTQPFPCDDVRATIFRTLVVFDLKQFDKVFGAELAFDTEHSISREGGETVGQSPPKSYATVFGLETFYIDYDDERSLPPGPSIAVGVTSQVQDWVANTRKNTGFVLAGPRGRPTQNSYSEDNLAQVSWYRDFRLRVTYDPSLNPRAPK